MSVDCTGYLGYTVTLKKDLSQTDFDSFYDFNDEHNEYDMFEHNEETEKVKLVIDGMNGNFARLVFVDEKIENCWVNDKEYFTLRSQSVPNDVYKQLNKAYKLMYNKDLDETLIEYALWFLFG